MTYPNESNSNSRADWEVPSGERRSSRRNERSGSSQRASRPESKRRGRATHGSQSSVFVRPLVIGGILALLIVALAVGTTAGVMWYRGKHALQRLDAALRPNATLKQEVDQELAATTQDSAFDYILLLGDDHRPGQDHARTDTIIVVAIEKSTGNVAMVSIPRDSRVEVAGHGMTKINHAGAWGGPALSIKTVRAFTGLPINHYIRIDFDGLAKLIDQLGGVDVFAQQYAGDKGSVRHLDGVAAVSFVRQRHIFASGDFARMDNQQRVLLQLSKKLKSPMTIVRIPRIVDALAGHMDSDLSVDDLTRVAKKIQGRHITSIVLTGTTGMIDGVSYVFPDEQLRKRVFGDLAAGRMPEDR